MCLFPTCEFPTLRRTPAIQLGFDRFVKYQCFTWNIHAVGAISMDALTVSHSPCFTWNNSSRPFAALQVVSRETTCAWQQFYWGYGEWSDSRHATRPPVTIGELGAATLCGGPPPYIGGVALV